MQPSCMTKDFNIDKSKNDSMGSNVEAMWRFIILLKPEKYKPINKQDLYVLYKILWFSIVILL